MSFFTLEHARLIADNAFRFRPDKFESPDQQKRLGEADRPLVGKEQKLLEALRAGEQRYRECKSEITAIGKLRKSDAELSRQCDGIADTLREIAEKLSRLDEVSREEMNAIALYQGSSFEDMSQRLDDLLDWFAKGADEAFPSPPVQKTAGAKLGMGKGGVFRVPLEEFAKELRNFLVQPDVGVKFSFEEVKREDLDPPINEPVSVAARLLYDAARILNDSVKIGDVRTVMGAVRRNPDFRGEFLGDPAVDDHTR
jgi:hypothetical protein